LEPGASSNLVSLGHIYQYIVETSTDQSAEIFLRQGSCGSWNIHADILILNRLSLIVSQENSLNEQNALITVGLKMYFAAGKFRL